MKKLLFVTLGITIIFCGGCPEPTQPEVITSPAVTAPAPVPIPTPAPVKPVYLNLTKGPVLLRVYQTRAAIMWETDTGEPQKLLYGNEQSGENSVVSMPERVEYEGSELLGLPIKKTVFLHKVWLENLAPGQTYNYHIESTATQNNTLRTLPADSNEITFVVYGDSRTNPQLHKRIVEQIIKTSPDFVIHTGDLVTNGNRYRQWGEQFLMFSFSRVLTT